MLEWALHYIDLIEESRKERSDQEPPELSEDEKENLIAEFHPDHSASDRPVQIGANAGGTPIPQELADLLEADSLLPKHFKPATDIETDVLIIGGGGAGASAALELQASGLQVLLATKLRLGDANTVMAEGGIQAAISSEDSPRRHFADAYVGGHGDNRVDLLKQLCEAGPETIQWLMSLGCQFDRNPDGSFRQRSGGGTSTPRVMACRDITGLEIMRVLREAVRQSGTPLLENHSAIELLDNGEGQVTGAVFWNRKDNKLVSVSARAVLLATGGSGQLRLQGFPTSNHFGATGDGLILAYRQGCKLDHVDTFQFHPSGTSFPEALAGQLVTEAIRSIGAQILNAEGKRFIDELTYRDVVASAIIKEVVEGRGIKTPSGRYGVWLDTPVIEMKQGPGTLKNQFPGLVHRFGRYGIDPTVHPILVYPTLHYQNGGVEIDLQGRTTIKGLWAAGEVSGGVHGRNRLMGNSLLDILVYGRKAAQSIQNQLPERAALGLSALESFRAERDRLGLSGNQSPQLFPVAAQVKVNLEEMVADDSSSTTETSPQSASTAFEPRDPFA